MARDAIQEFVKLKAEADKARREADKAKGVEEVLLKQLRQEFGCKTIEEATDLLTTWEEEYTRLEEQFTKEVADFKAKWKEYLES